MKFSHIKIYFLILLIIVNVLIFHTIFAEQKNNLLKIYFLDIGQGDAIFIEAPNGNQVLIDAGPNKNILSALSRVMPIYDRSLDMIIATHPDADHIGGFPSVLENYSVSNYIYNGATGTTGVFREVASNVEDKKISIHIARRKDVIDLGDGVHLDILSPDSDPQGKDTNEYSIVAELIYGNTKVLLTGDAPTDVEEKLVVSDGIKLKSDILKVAHHGSKNSYSKPFLDVVAPEYSVISAGKDNRYGHPHKIILDALSEIKTIIFQTMNEGDINFVSDGNFLKKV